MPDGEGLHLLETKVIWGCGIQNKKIFIIYICKLQPYAFQLQTAMNVSSLTNMCYIIFSFWDFHSCISW